MKRLNFVGIVLSGIGTLMSAYQHDILWTVIGFAAMTLNTIYYYYGGE